jgi:hypothetical protein
MSCPHARSDGAYVLGALSPSERTAYETHLAGCGECASAVARLAPVPGLLGRVDPAALHPGTPGPTRLPELLQKVAQQRRRRVRVGRLRLAAAALAAAALTVTGTAVWSELGLDGSGARTHMVAMEPVAAVVPVAAQVATRPAAGGTEVRMACQYPAVAYEVPANTFRLVAVGPGGVVEQLGSWSAEPGDEVTMTGLTRFTGAELRRIELHNSSGDVLLAYEVT